MDDKQLQELIRAIYDVEHELGTKLDSIESYLASIEREVKDIKRKIK